jgi:hypothetical protein
VRLDAPEGKLLGKGRMPAPGKDQKSGSVDVRISPVSDARFHKVYFIYTPSKNETEMQAGVMGVKFAAR